MALNKGISLLKALVPNKKTIKAIKETKSLKIKSFKTIGYRILTDGIRFSHKRTGCLACKGPRRYSHTPQGEHSWRSPSTKAPSNPTPSPQASLANAC